MLQLHPGMTIANIKRIAGHSLEGMMDRYTHSRYEEAIKVLHMLERYWEEIVFNFKHDKMEQYTPIIHKIV